MENYRMLIERSRYRSGRGGRDKDKGSRKKGQEPGGRRQKAGAGSR